MSTLTSNLALIDAFIEKHGAVRALPENATKVIRMTSDPDCTTAQLMKYISQDAGLAAQIIKTVNSAYYALPTKMTRLDLAIAYMGVRTVKEVAVSCSIGAFCKPRALGNYDARDLWDHCLGVAILARELAERSGRINPEEAFTAGLLHDIGLLIASQAEPEKCTDLFNRAEAADAPFASIEQAIFGFSHDELGERLAAKWKFPEYLASAIRWHHHPAEAPAEHRDVCLLSYIADNFCSSAKVGIPLTCRLQEVSDEQLEAVNLSRDRTTETSAKLRVLLRLFV